MATPPLPEVEGVEFKPVPGFDGYALGSDGSVWSSKWNRRWHRLAVKGRGTVSLSKNGRVWRLSVNTLISSLFPRAPNEPGVEYRPVPGAANYMVGSDGSVWSRVPKSKSPLFPVDSWRRLRLTLRKTGYVAVGVRMDGEREPTWRGVHQLVLLAFVGPPAAGQETRHLNGNPGDNRLDNLAWGTAAENTADRIRHGTHVRGEDSHFAKLSESQVIEIRKKYAGRSGTITELAVQYDVSPDAVSFIVKGRSWSHLPLFGSNLVKASSYRISDTVVAAIREEYSHGGVTQASLARKYGISKHTVHHLVRNKCRKSS